MRTIPPASGSAWPKAPLCLPQRFMARLLVALALAGELLLTAPAVSAAENIVLDRLEADGAPGEPSIHLRFNVPVRFVSLSSDDSERLLQVFIQPVAVSDLDVEALAGREELSWEPSEEMPLQRVVYEGIENFDDIAATRSGQQATLVFHFARPVTAYQLLDDKDFRGLRLVLPVLTAAVGGAATASTAAPDESLAREVIRVAPEIPAVPGASPLEHPQGRYAVNLASADQTIDATEHAPLPHRDGYRLYTSEALVDGALMQHLRLGFFDDIDEARQVADELRERFPDVWIDRVRSSERNASAGRALGADGAPLVVTATVADGTLPAASERQSELLARARESMTAGDHRRAIRFLTALTEDAAHAHSREALELLGVARERNGQLAQANAVYRQYIARYPEGEASDRVRQRIAGLSTATDAPREPLRSAERTVEGVEWERYGSLSQYYRRESVESDLAGDGTVLSELDSLLIAGARYRGANHDMRAQFTGGYAKDFLDDGDDEGRISELYFDWRDRQRGFSLRGGRQRHNTSGTLGRFDGILGGYQLDSQLRINAVVGRPVQSSSDTFINGDQRFYGVSADLGTFADHWDFSLFAIEQETEGETDRRALGGEVRYFDSRGSLFGALDYDILFDELNTLLLLGNWAFDDNTTGYFNIDYRNTPTLVLRNALIGQPVNSLGELAVTLNIEQIRELARNRTQRARLFSLGGSRPLAEELQISLDLTVSNLQESDTSGGVEAVPGTENEYYYNARLIRSNMIKDGDIGIIGLQYADGDAFDTVSVDLNSRYPTNNGWRFNPRLRLSLREGNNDGSQRLTFAPLLRSEYRLRRQLAFELELGVDRHEDEDANGTQESTTEYHLSLGYRWDY